MNLELLAENKCPGCEGSFVQVMVSLNGGGFACRKCVFRCTIEEYQDAISRHRVIAALQDDKEPEADF